MVKNGQSNLRVITVNKCKKYNKGFVQIGNDVYYIHRCRGYKGFENEPFDFLEFITLSCKMTLGEFKERYTDEILKQMKRKLFVLSIY